MLFAIMAFLAFLPVAAFAAYAMAWQAVFQRAIFSPGLNSVQIFGRMKGRVLSRSWLLTAVGGAALIATATLVSDELPRVYLIIAAVVLVCIVSGVRAHKLFYAAVAELGIKYPPEG